MAGCPSSRVRIVPAPSVALLATIAMVACGDGGGGPSGPQSGVQFVAVRGGDQTAPWGGLLPDSLVVQASTSKGPHVEHVTWNVISGGGRIVPPSGPPSPTGRTAAAWHLGPTPGVQEAEARLSSGASVRFRATGVAGTAPVFTAPLVPFQSIRDITALGNMNPPSHTIPSDHIYFYLTGPNCPCTTPPTTPVSAPASGVVDEVIRGNGSTTDDQIFVRVAPHVVYYVLHVRLPAGITAGQRITEGQSLGVTSGLTLAVDLGVMNFQRAPVRYVDPGRYPDRAVYADAPLRYYADSVRSRLYAKVTRTGTDKDGRHDYDVPARLLGGWFVEGTSRAESASQFARQLQFAYLAEDPAVPVVAVGGTVAPTGVYLLDGPDPSQVSATNGIVVYRLRTTRGTPWGSLVVQVQAGERLRVQAVAGEQTVASFVNDPTTTYIR